MYRAIIILPFHNSIAKGGPRRAQTLSNVCCDLPLRSRYSNRTVKYSNKAVKRPGCAPPNLPSLPFQANSTETQQLII